tara:strand:+ start:1235 stop:1774 length:540 start_codon:yes stop_codon:yes gene_type:complete
MAQEFFINSEGLEDKIRQLLPSQGGAGAGFDLSASTQIVPIIDLTSTAEGGGLPSALQSALSHNQVTSFDRGSSGTSTLITNTGYWRVFGCANNRGETSGSDPKQLQFSISDGATSKIIIAFEFYVVNSISIQTAVPFDFVVFLGAGDSLTATTNGNQASLIGCTRQLASIDGTLVNPT